MPKSLLLIGFFSVVTPSFAQTTEYFLSVESLSISDTVPVYSYFHQLDGQSQRGDYAFTRNQLKAGVRYPFNAHSQIEFSVLSRYDYGLTFSPDSFDLFYREKNKLPARENTSSDIDISALELQGEGIELAHIYQDKHWHVVTGLSIVNIARVLDSTLTGQLITDNDSYEGNLLLTQHYTRDTILDRQVSKDRGLGWSLRIGVEWHYDDFAISYQADDITSRIYWDELAFTDASLQPRSVSFDENGLLNVTPNITGDESYQTHQQSFDALHRLHAQYHLNDKLTLNGELIHYRQQSLPYVGADFPLADNSRISVAYGIADKAIAVGVQTAKFSARLQLSNIDYQQARSIGFNIGVIF